MITTLITHGDDLALTIDQNMMDALGIDHNTPLELVSDGEVLVILPLRDETEAERFNEILEELNKRYGRALNRLAE